ncbi:MAG: hypothetical protein HKN87_05370 [Saprospiraceae bacterium]|nr:hypothetical protein [Saprospiraceae bacterium]
MISQGKIDLIEQYLNNELSEADRSGLEQDLATDAELAAEFNRRETAHMAMDFMIAENLRAELRTLEGTQAKTITMAPRRRRLYPLAIAASLIILIGALFMIQGGGSDPAALAASHYTAPDFTFRSGGDDIPTEITKGLQELKDQDYVSAINTLSQVDTDSPFEVLATYYIGHAYFAAKDFALAQSQFEKVVEAGDIRYSEDAEWYALLSCLAQEQTCAVPLEQIRSDIQHPYQKQAEEISDKLN